MKRVLAIALLSLSSTITYAGDASGAGKITMLNIPATGDFVAIKFSQDIKNQGCGDNTMYLLETPADGSADQAYSALLSAYMAKTTVSFWISGCTTVEPWGKTWPKVFDVYLH